MDLEFIAHLGIALAAGFLGGLGGAAVSRAKHIAMPIVPAFIIGHKHDWHIKGKRNGRVRLYCTHPRCTVEKYQGEGW